jgi:hypothetical protein
MNAKVTEIATPTQHRLEGRDGGYLMFDGETYVCTLTQVRPNWWVAIFPGEPVTIEGNTMSSVYKLASYKASGIEMLNGREL